MSADLSATPLHRKPLFMFFSILTIGWIIGSVFYYGMFRHVLKDGGDAWGYYIYLPSAIISHDLRTLEYIALKRKEGSPHTINPGINHLGFGEVNIAPTGHPVIKYTSGVALMLSPFFLIAHILAQAGVAAADGFNDLYWVSAYLGVIAWVIIGMIFLYRTLIRYFDPKVVFGTLLSIALGTNLYYFMVYNSPMSHAPLMALYGMLVYFTDTFYRKPGTKTGFAIGLLCGLITMIRPVELICILIPLLWRIQGPRERFTFLRKHAVSLLMAGVGFALSVLPQLLYWKVTSNEWIFYSYGEEGFNFLKSRFWKGLTGFSNGWFVYTPLMLLIVPGFVILYKHHRGMVIALLAFMVLHIYITYSWHNWYYINSFGSRPMVETYALMAFPLCAVGQRFMYSRAKWLLVLAAVFFIWLNQLQTLQVYRAIMLSEDGSRVGYRAIFGKTRMTEHMLISVDTREKQPDRSRLDSLGVIASYVIEQDSLAFEAHNDTLIRLSPDPQPVIMLYPAHVALLPGDYLRISVEGYSEGWNGDRWGMATTTSSFERNGKSYKWRWNRINNKWGNPTWNLWGAAPHEWGEAWYFVKVPDTYVKGDVIRVWCENRGAVPVVLRKFQIEHWRK